jgi:pyrroloquinoline quinone biosynthesis protein D
MSEASRFPVGKPERAVLSPASQPAFPGGTRLWHDKSRGQWVILAPERIFKLDDIAVAVLKLCDGKRTVDQIAFQLAASYSAPRERILADILPMLQELADKGVVRA